MTIQGSARHAARAAVAILAATSLVAACGDDDDEAETTDEVAEASIEVSGAWARTSPAVAEAGAVYLTMTNDGEVDDTLIGAEVDASVAAKTEIHETVEVEGSDTTMEGGMSSETTAMDGGDEMATDTTATDGGMGGGMMEMQPVDEIPLPAGATVALEPGGYHVMLLELVEPLETGATIEVVLTFQEAGEVTVAAEVRDTAP